jgi:hypothetical protein
MYQKPFSMRYARQRKMAKLDLVVLLEIRRIRRIRPSPLIRHEPFYFAPEASHLYTGLNHDENPHVSCLKHDATPSGRHG